MQAQQNAAPTTHREALWRGVVQLLQVLKPCVLTRECAALVDAPVRVHIEQVSGAWKVVDPSVYTALQQIVDVEQTVHERVCVRVRRVVGHLQAAIAGRCSV